MSKKNPNKILGILLLIAAGLMLINIPFIDGDAIGILIVVGAAIYSFIRN